MTFIRLLLISLGLVCAYASAQDTYRLNGKDISIPPPDGYVKVTEEMSAVMGVVRHMADSMNDTLACFIPKEDEAAALAGELPVMDKYFVVKVNKQIRNRTVTKLDFKQLKDVTKSQNDRIFDDVKRKIPGEMNRMSQGLSSELDVDMAIQLSQMIPLPPHEDSEDSFAFSMYMSYGVRAANERMTDTMSSTAAFVNASGTVIFLYSYAPKPDLEWTRSSTAAWTQRIIADNAPAPEGRGAALSGGSFRTYLYLAGLVFLIGWLIVKLVKKVAA